MQPHHGIEQGHDLLREGTTDPGSPESHELHEHERKHGPAREQEGEDEPGHDASLCAIESLDQ